MSLECARCPVRDKAACSALTHDEREELARSGRMLTLKRGDILFAAGDTADACATLVSGALKVTRTTAAGDERILAVIHPAGFVGEMFSGFTKHDVIALADSTLCLFSGQRFSAAIESYPALGTALLRRTQEDLFSGRELLALAGGGSALGRVAGLVLALANGASTSPCHPAANFELPLTRGEMGAMLGLTIETVSRMLGRLEQDGTISRTGARGIALHDPTRLAALAEAIEA